MNHVEITSNRTLNYAAEELARQRGGDFADGFLIGIATGFGCMFSLLNKAYAIKKGLYVNSTPFHAGVEYGELVIEQLHANPDTSAFAAELVRAFIPTLSNA